MRHICFIFVAAMLLLSGIVLGQGTVTFNNTSTTKVVCGNGAAQIYGVAYGAPVPRDPNPALKASLYYSSTQDGDYTWLADTSFSKLAPGRFISQPQTIPGIAPESIAWFQVKIWEFSIGVNSYEQAITSSHAYGGRAPIVGVSRAFSVRLGAEAPGVLASGLTSIEVDSAPEPSSVALGLLGLAGMFVMRRRS